MGIGQQETDAGFHSTAGYLESGHSANDMMDIHIPKPDDQGAIIILNTERT